jgi:hypothetical protein
MHVRSTTVGSILISLISDEFKKLNLIKIPDKHYILNTKHNHTTVLYFMFDSPCIIS